MASLNKVLLIGRLGQNPEKRVTPSGASVISISLATSERFKDKSGQFQERTEWHRLVFWNRLAENVEQYCQKGSQLYVEGSLQTNDWQDKDGNKRYTTEIVVRNMQMLDSRGQGQMGQQQQQGGFQQQQQPMGGQMGQQQPQQPFVPSSLNTGFQEPAGGPQGPNSLAGDDFIEDDIPF